MCNVILISERRDIMRKINEFAELCKTSAKTLRFYDQAGVLSPDYVDPENGYRYYTDDQVEQYNQIVELKQAGFTLEEIKNSFGCTDDTAVLEMLRRKEAELAEACSHCRDMIRVYEERMNRGAEGNSCRIHRLTEKQRIILDDGKSWVTLPCRREDMDRCYAVLERLFMLPGYINISLADMKMHFDREKPMLYMEASEQDFSTLRKALESRFWPSDTCRGLRTIITEIEVMPETIQRINLLDEIELLTTEILKHFPEDFGFTWGISLGKQLCVRVLGIF